MRFRRAMTAFALLLGLFVGLAAVPQTTMAATALVSGDECNRDGIVDAIAEAGDGGLVSFDCESTTIYFDDWIDIQSTVTIDGSNNGSPITLDGQAYSSFFEVLDGGDLTLQHLTMQNGYVYLLGGAIYNSGGTLTVVQCTFRENGVSYFGGAIANGGTTTISQSTFIDNYGEGSFFQYSYGGAIDNYGVLTISQSSFIGNSADYAGAISTTDSGTLTITSSTFTDNRAWSAASTMQLDGPTTIQDSTIMQTNTYVSALWILDSLTLSNVILTGDSQLCSIDDAGLITDDHTLAKDDSCGLTGEGSLENVGDLGLMPLESATVNGVEQSYFPLAEDSPAVNGGSMSCAAVDQIGNPRPYNFYCDIGAVESTFTTSLLCANQWNGALSMASDDGCGRSETMINIQTDRPIALCVNKWNGAARASDRCSRSEHQLTIYGEQQVSLCVNRWTDAIRVSNHCSRSEYQAWL